MPYKFIGIEIGCIRRQKMQFQLSAAALHIGFDELGLVAGMAIYNQIYLSSAASTKVPKKFHKPGGVEHAGVNRAPESAACADRTHGTDLLSLARGRH